MLLATLVLLCPLPQTDDTARATEIPAAVSTSTTKDSSPSNKLPSAPEPKVKTDAEIVNSANSEAPAESILPGAAPIHAGRSTFTLGRETPRQRKLCYGLAFTGHSAAAFDAWSTRRAISGGYGTEANPLLRPFANSGALYAATQVSPLVMDYLGRRMMTSSHTWVRRMWWLPQTAGTGMSLAAGVHNVGLTH
jgi:hypothetical protein